MNNWNWHPCTWHCDRLQVIDCECCMKLMPTHLINWKLLHHTDACIPNILKNQCCIKLTSAHWYTQKCCMKSETYTHTWCTEKCCITQCLKRTHWHSVAQDLKPEQNIFQFYIVPVANAKPGKTLLSLKLFVHPSSWLVKANQDSQVHISNMKQCTYVAVYFLAHLKQNPELSISSFDHLCTQLWLLGKTFFKVVSLLLVLVLQIQASESCHTTISSHLWIITLTWHACKFDEN